MLVPGSSTPLLAHSAAAAATGISRSLRFNSSDSAYLSRTPASAGNRRTFTFAAWIKRTSLSDNEEVVFSAQSGTTSFRDFLEFANNKLVFTCTNSSNVVTANIQTTAVFRDPSAWFHVTLAIDTTQGTASNRVKIYVNEAQITVFSLASYPSQNTDFSFNDTRPHTLGQAASGTGWNFNGYLADIYFIDGQALTPSSFTETDATTGQLIPKAYTGSYGTNGFHLEFADNSSNTATTLGKDTSGNGNNWTPNNLSVISAKGTTQSTTGTTLKYITNYNGVDVLTTVNGVTWSSDFFGSAVPNTAGDNIFFDFGSGKLSSACRFSFGFTNSVTKADGQGGAMLFYDNSGNVIPSANVILLEASDSRFGPAISGTSYTFTVASTSAPIRYVSVSPYFRNYGTINSVSITGVDLGYLSDSLVDVPTNGAQTDTGVGAEVRGNYCTWNPLSGSLGTRTLSNGNLDTSNSGNGNTYSTFELSSGKFYFEATLTAISGSTGSTFLGLTASSANRSADNAQNLTPNVGYVADGSKVIDASGSAYGASYTSNDVIGVAVDLDAGSITFYKNGVSQGAISKTFIGAGKGSWAIFTVAAASGASNSWVLNAGARPFAYTAPSGFKALCTANLPAPGVTKPNTVFDVKLYTGNGSTNTITGLGFSPDLVWLKARDHSNWHDLYDQVRGRAALSSNVTNAERALPANKDFGTFDSNGFTLLTPQDTDLNGSGNTYVAWAWDAGSTTVTNNTAGTITPTGVRANATAGFSVCTFSVTTAGSISTFGTGLGASPEFVIIKPRNATTDWAVFHGSATSTPLRTRLLLNSTGAVTNYGSDVWSRSSTTLGVDTSILAAPGTAIDCVAYCFAPVVGYSSFGSFNPTGTSDSSFVYCGFRPRLLLVKQTTNTSNWIVWDTSRDSYNYASKELYPNLSDAEMVNSSTYSLDVVSNGFKMRNPGMSSGSTWIYCAWADVPFNYARAR